MPTRNVSALRFMSTTGIPENRHHSGRNPFFARSPFWKFAHRFSSSGGGGSFFSTTPTTTGRRLRARIGSCHRDVSSLQLSLRAVHQVPSIPPSSPLGIPIPTLRPTPGTREEYLGREEEAFEAARDALLQFNLMVGHGIEPDALMYTSLIAIMGRARLEWHAYKLFSRMIEAHVRPVPETYLALRDATAPSRRALREDIQRKVEEAMATFPERLAESEWERRRREDTECWKTFMACIEEGEKSAWPETPTTLPLPVGVEGKAVETPDEHAKTHKRDEKGENRLSSMGSSEDTEATSPPPPPGTTTGTHTTTTATTTTTMSSSPPPLATVKIRHPREVWQTAQLAETLRETETGRAKGEGRDRLAGALNGLHEEELRIFLTIHRQLRHGSKAQLIERVLQTVSRERIEAMLVRRQYYFRSVEKLLKQDLEIVKGNQEGGSSSDTSLGISATLSSSERHRHEPDVLYTPWGFLRKPARLLSKPTASETEKKGDDTGRGKLPAVRTTEREEGGGEHLPTHFLRLPLTEEEIALVRAKAMSSDIDELPEALLRRYAYMFRLRWRRRHATASGLPERSSSMGGGHTQALTEVVTWHATTFFHDIPAEEGSSHISSTTTTTSTGVPMVLFTPSPAASTALRRQREKEGMQKTLEHYEAFRLIAHRTQNLQVVDNKEINLHLHRIRREARAAARQAADFSRREGHKEAALSMAERATQFDGPLLQVEDTTPPLGGAGGGGRPLHSASNRYGTVPHGGGGGGPWTETTTSRVLGWQHASTPSACAAEKDMGNPEGDAAAPAAAGEEEEEGEDEAVEEKAPTEEEEEGDELPPWELAGKEEEFDIATGRFGDPNVGTYRELSDSHIRLLPQHEAQKKWRVDLSLLPSSLKNTVREASQQQERVMEEMEREYQRRLQYKKYKKWDELLRKAKKKKKLEKAALEKQEYEVQEEARRRRWEERRTPTDSLSLIPEEGEEEERGSEGKFSSSNGRDRGGGRPVLARRPIPATKRLSQLLRKGLHRQQVSPSLLERYNPRT